MRRKVRESNMDKGAWYVTEIKKILDSKGVEYEHLTHAPTPSALDTGITGWPLSSAIKALLVEGERTHTHYLLCIPGDRKLDIPKVKTVLGERVVFLKPEIVLEKYGLVVGGVPPIGSLLEVRTYIDQRVLENEIVDFCCGLSTDSIIMKADVFASLEGNGIVDISKPVKT